MRTVWKFSLSPDVQSIAMPAGAEILTVQTQGDEPMLWALVDPSAPVEERPIYVGGTGHPFPDDGRYVGTFQLSGGALVFHVVEGGQQAP